MDQYIYRQAGRDVGGAGETAAARSVCILLTVAYTLIDLDYIHTS